MFKKKTAVYTLISAQNTHSWSALTCNDFSHFDKKKKLNRCGRKATQKSKLLAEISWKLSTVLDFWSFVSLEVFHPLPLDTD